MLETLNAGALGMELAPTIAHHKSGLLTPKSPARKKPIDINIFGGTVSRTNRNRPRDKMGPLPGTKMGPVPGTNRPFAV